MLIAQTPADNKRKAEEKVATNSLRDSKTPRSDRLRRGLGEAVLLVPLQSPSGEHDCVAHQYRPAGFAVHYGLGLPETGR